MSWTVRHEGSPRSIENLTLQQVVDGLRDNLWEPTDEVRGPDDAQWVPIESHPQLADVVLDIEPPERNEPEDESRLDMNPLIDVALVLLIFFILTTTYESIRKVLEMPNAAAAGGKVKSVTPEQAKAQMVKLEVRLVNGKPVIKVDDQVVDQKDLSATLKRVVRESQKTQMLIDAADDVVYETVVQVQDAARGAGIEKAFFLAAPPKAPAPEP